MMKTISTQQEILLVTGTAFGSREWAEKNTEDSRKLTAIEKLEDACWNGLLNEMLPEMMEKTSEGKNLLLWHVRSCKSLIQIGLCEDSPKINAEFSIDPYLFFPGIRMS